MELSGEQAFSVGPAGIVLTALVSGKEGLQDLFGKLRIWRVRTGWWASAVFSVLGVVVLGNDSKCAIQSRIIRSGQDYKRIRLIRSLLRDAHDNRRIG